MAIQFVGRTGGSRGGTSSSTTQSLTALTGGIASSPSEGDLVLIALDVGAAAGRNPSCAISGWNTIGTQLNVTAKAYQVCFQVSYKFMGSTPDTSITIPGSQNIADGQAWQVLVFRGVDSTTPFDVASVSATGSGVSTNWDAAAIQPTTAGAFIVIMGGGATGGVSTYVAPSGFIGWGTSNGNDTNDGSCGAGYYDGWTSGSYDPAAVTGGQSNTDASWAAWTIALRPGTSNQTLTQSSSYTNSNTTYTHTLSVGEVALTASLYQNTNTYYTHTANLTLLQDSVYYETNSYYTHSLTSVVELTASLYENTNTYYGASLVTDQLLEATLYSATSIFYDSTITSVYELTADLYTNESSYFTHEVSIQLVQEELLALVNEFYTHQVETDQAVLPDFFVLDTNQYFSASIRKQYPDPSQVLYGIIYGEPPVELVGTYQPDMDRSVKIDLVSGKLVKPVNNKVVLTL